MSEVNLLDIWKNSPLGTRVQNCFSIVAETDNSMKPFFADDWDIVASDLNASRHLPTLNDDTFLFSNPQSGSYSITTYYFCCNETNAIKLQFDVKISNYQYSGCSGYARAEYADSQGNVTINGIQFCVSGTQHEASMDEVISGDAWVTLEIDFTEQPINYIALGGWWGDYEFRNIKLIGVTNYNWQSVPSVSGKNGILFLSTIQSVYLNDGEPVNNALESYIDFIDDSKVAVLVEQEIDDLTKVTVKYVVPAGTYEYIKLVYKVGSAPTSITDGTAVDILQAAKQVSISGIADGSTYFFKIFTDSTESEPYEFTTVKPEPIVGNVFAPNFSIDGRDVLRYDPNKTIHIYHQDSGGSTIHDYTVICGALFDLKYPSSPQYTISNNELVISNNSGCYFGWAYDVDSNHRIIPANCTLWFEFDAYFLNIEGYLDWRMFNGQDSETIYWCWDTKYEFSSGIWYNCKLEATVVNGIITYAKYYVDDVMIGQRSENIHMLCIDEENSIPCKLITFNTTAPTKIKNMKIYSETE